MRFLFSILALCVVPAIGFSGTIWVPDDHLKIQDAIQAAGTGDEIIVRSDTYLENIDFLGKAITLRSESGAAVTTIDGRRLGSVVTFSPDLGGPPTIEGFTILGGLAAQGGGIYCEDSDPTISRCVLVDNATLDGTQPGDDGGCGGGVYGSPSAFLTLLDCTIASNTTGRGSDNFGDDAGNGGDGGGICCSLATIVRCFIRANATGAGGDSDCSVGRGGRGAGIFCASGTFTDCVIDSNKSGDGGEGSVDKGGNGGDGGGVYFSSASPEPTMSGCTVTDNSTGNGGPNMGNDGGDGGSGGGVFCITATFSDSVFKRNRTGDGTYDYGNGGDGGAIYGSTLTIDSCFLNSNTTGSGAMGWAGGGNGGSGGAIYCTAATISASIISGNLTGDGNGHEWGSDGGDGGGIFCASAKLDGCIVSGNTTGNGGDATFDGGWGGDGGGIYFSSSSPVPALTSCALCGNRTGHGGDVDDGDGGRGGNGAAIHCVDVDLGCCTLSDNQTGAGGGGTPPGPEGTGGGVYGSSGSVVNSILWANVPDEMAGGTFTVDYSDVDGGWAGTDNIDTDPLFADRANGDYHLTWLSACRNKGDDSAVTATEDFEGDPRICFSRVDMGADEFWYHLYSTGDAVPAGTIDIKIVGMPGHQTVRLALGSGLLDPPYWTQHGYLWLNVPFVWKTALGALPGDGILVFSTVIPAWWTQGEKKFFQALVGQWGYSTTQLTNPMILTVE